MKSSRYKLLPCSRCPGYENRRTRRSNQRNLLVELYHLVAVTNQPGSLAILLDENCCRIAGVPPFQCSPSRRYYFIHIKRFADVVECSLANRLNSRFESAETAYQDHFRGGRDGLEFLEQSHAGCTAAQIDITDDQIEVRAFDSLAGSLWGLAGIYLPAFLCENFREEVAGLQIIVDNEYSLHDLTGRDALTASSASSKSTK